MKKISRTWARVSILLAAAAALCIAVGFFLHSPELMGSGCLFLILSSCIKNAVLRCPWCGWRGGMPRWRGSGMGCPKCGRPMEYDR